MGLARRHRALHFAQLGQELHGFHQFLLGLRSWLRQVQSGQHDFGHRRDHHTAVGIPWFS